MSPKNYWRRIVFNFEVYLLRFRRHATIAVAISITLVAAGCTTPRGPRSVLNAHTAYNKAVSQVLSEELLLNIVRRRYLEAPQFVTVSSISASLELSQSVGISGTYDITGNGNTSSQPTYSFSPGSGITISGTNANASALSPLSINAGLEYSDSPTITFTPRQGEDIATPLHASMSLDVLAEMANAGYGFDLLLFLLVQDINGVRSVEAGVGDSFRGGSAEFLELLHLIHSLSSRDELVVGFFEFEDPYNADPFPAAQVTPDLWLTAVATDARWRSYDGGEHYYLTTSRKYPAMWMSANTRKTGDGARVIELLNLDPEPLKPVWVFKGSKTIAGPEISNRPDVPRAELKARLRSFYGVLNLLAYGIEVPQKDDEEGKAFSSDRYLEIVNDGRFEEVRSHFKIKSDNAKPDSAFIAVPYRNTWFYIEDADVTSKRIFNALYDLFNLQVSPSGGDTSPVLTLPVK